MRLDAELGGHATDEHPPVGQARPSREPRPDEENALAVEEGPLQGRWDDRVGRRFAEDLAAGLEEDPVERRGVGDEDHIDTGKPSE